MVRIGDNKRKCMRCRNWFKPYKRGKQWSRICHDCNEDYKNECVERNLKR